MITKGIFRCAHWCPLVLIGAHWCPLEPIGAHWCPLVPIGAHWCSLVPIGDPLVPIGAHWCPLVPIGALDVHIVCYPSHARTAMALSCRLPGHAMSCPFSNSLLLRCWLLMHVDTWFHTPMARFGCLGCDSTEHPCERLQID